MAQDHDALQLRRWRLDSTGRLRWRSWDGEMVVFHEPTASTHMLPPDAATVFELLAEVDSAWTDEAGLLAALAGPGDEPETLHRQLRDILDSLLHSGLAECRAP